MDEHLPKRILYAIAIAGIFIAIGWMLPNLYFHYLDKTDYYTIVQPIPVSQKWYKPCDEVILTITRDSMLDFTAVVTTELVLKRGDDVIFKVPNVRFTRDIIVTEGENITVQTSYPLPCDLADGLYYWQLGFDYRVKDVNKTYLAVSDTFNVNEFGADPNAIEEATKSGSLRTQPINNPARKVSTPTPQPTSQPQQIIINNEVEQPQPQPTPNPTPTPTNEPEDQVCLPIIGCI